MANYLNVFETQSAYDAAKYGLDYPNVSVLTENPSTPIYVETKPVEPHDYVEIGGVKWATMNVGATGITDYGLYFQWGDAKGYTASQVGSGESQKYFGWEDYKYGNGTSNPRESGITKYTLSDGKTVLEASDDAVTANWGGSWRMPTTDEYIALGNATTSALTSNYQGSGKAGLILTSKANTNIKLFFPAAGSCNKGNVINIGDAGTYWSSSRDSSSGVNAYAMNLNKTFGTMVWQTYSTRYYGYAVRGVLGA